MTMFGSHLRKMFNVYPKLPSNIHIGLYCFKIIKESCEYIYKKKLANVIPCIIIWQKLKLKN